MTVINKVNDDSVDYFRDRGGICFVIQCYARECMKGIDLIGYFINFDFWCYIF
jgi:hypothetical protein